MSSPLTLNDDRLKGSPYCNARSGVMPTAHNAANYTTLSAIAQGAGAGTICLRTTGR